ncbi:ATP-dependent Clp protease ATP-binding subunit [Candidatus Parcubacteria bacterium]|nr:ATP-dependent Clp protease ATP-binding subunit [Candidatus Parcubacteria bacterium]
MFNFNIKRTRIFQSIRYSQNPVLKFANFWKKLFSVLFLISLLLSFYNFAEQSQSNSSAFALGLTVLSLTLMVVFWLLEIFYNSLLKPKLKFTIEDIFAHPEKEYNLAEVLDLEAARAVWQTMKFAKAKKLDEIDSIILFYFLLKNKGEQVNFIFFRANLDLESFIQGLKKEIKKERGNSQLKYTKDFKEVVLEALRSAHSEKQDMVGAGCLMVGLAEQNPLFKEILIHAELKKEDIANLSSWFSSAEKKMAGIKRWWTHDNLLKFGSLGKEWASGYTITLDQYSIDWTAIGSKQGFGEIIGHKTEIEETERVLARSEINNALLVGRPGTNRKNIIRAIAEKARLGTSLAQINHKRIVELNIPSVLSQTSSPEEAEEILDKIFHEVAAAGNIILVIDEFNNYVGQENRLGATDISGILAQYLHLSQFQIVAITSYAGLHKQIEQRPTILNLFAKVEVDEISEKETILFLKNLTYYLENKHRIIVSYPALRDIIKYTTRYMPNLPFPKKAINILDEAVVYVANSTNSHIVLPEHIIKLISDKTQIPIGEAQKKEKEVLLDLENLIHKRLINQEKAVKDISTALRRSRAAISTKKGPMGTFLFLGPTGVGKTETAKALAAIYFGSEDKIIRLDMSEFQAIEDIPRLIGSPGQEGLLTTKIREDPFSLLLLDELEKAHPNILNLFLQVLDEGHLTDGIGRKVSFKDSIIIATSNAGYKVILESIKEKTDWPEVKQKILDFIFERAIFRPEFVNRFDGVTIFKPLSQENLLDIAQLLLNKLKKNLDDKGIKFQISEELKEKIVELGYNPAFGARAMKRVIQDKVENVLAEAVLREEISKGEEITLNANFEIIKIT